MGRVKFRRFGWLSLYKSIAIFSTNCYFSSQRVDKSIYVISSTSGTYTLKQLLFGGYSFIITPISSGVFLLKLIMPS